jgi:hypothetical protein
MRLRLLGSKTHTCIHTLTHIHTLSLSHTLNDKICSNTTDKQTRYRLHTLDYIQSKIIGFKWLTHTYTHTHTLPPSLTHTHTHTHTLDDKTCTITTDLQLILQIKIKCKKVTNATHYTLPRKGIRKKKCLKSVLWLATSSTKDVLRNFTLIIPK